MSHHFVAVTVTPLRRRYCRNCGNIDNTIASENICVSKVNVKHKTTPQTFSQVVNKYTKLDPTLPRIHTMRCPNDECSSNQGNTGGGGAPKSEIIYVRYDDTNLKYVYLCAKCDKVWNTEQH